jgi:enoyl-CoA hydratase
LTSPDPVGSTPDSASPPVLARGEGPVQVITLNRPDRLNAVNAQMYRDLLRFMRCAGNDPEVRAVVLTGAGRAFCSGADLKAHREGPPRGAERRRYIQLAQRANRVIQSGPVPVVAAVNGHAIGAGLELALSADFMIVADQARLRLPEVALGTFVGGGVVSTLAERVGVLRARELIYFGDPFTGREAREMGIASRALPADEVLDEAMRWAARLAECAPRSLAAAKRLVGVRDGADRRRAMREEARVLEALFGTADWAEGVAAFTEKRRPRFTGE